jgi:hypothetical protein
VKRKKSNAFQLSKQYLAESEMQVLQQKRLVEELRNQGRQTARAERALQILETKQLTLRNHFHLMQVLMQSDSYPAVEENSANNDVDKKSD